MSEASSPRQPIATWNPARGVWEKNQALFCGHLEPWLETWPTSGMTLGGQLFELPTREPATVEPESSSSPNLLGTPQARDAKGRPGAGFNAGNLQDCLAFLPTPTASDMTGAETPGHRKESGRGGQSLRDLPKMLPTPKASDGPHGGPGQKNSRGQVDSLPAISQLLPTPTSQAAKHGSLAPIELDGDRPFDNFNLWVVLPRLTLSTSDPTPTPSTDKPEQ